MAGTSPKILRARRVEQGHVIKATNIAGQTQLERPTELLGAIAFALGGFVDKHAPHSLHFRPGDLQVDDRESGRGSDGDCKAERKGEPESARSKNLNRRHRV